LRKRYGAGPRKATLSVVNMVHDSKSPRRESGERDSEIEGRT